MTRSPARAPKLTEAETVRGDFAEPATLKDAFAGVSAALVVSDPASRVSAPGCTGTRFRPLRTRV